MYQYLPIRDVYAREILDSRGNPTIEVEVLAGETVVGRASVPENMKRWNCGIRRHGTAAKACSAQWSMSMTSLQAR